MAEGIIRYLQILNQKSETPTNYKLKRQMAVFTNQTKKRCMLLRTMTVSEVITLRRAI